MHNSARLFNCARCRRQVAICSHCDRGNIYCDKRCSQAARRRSCRQAGKRYQKTRRGRLSCLPSVSVVIANGEGRK
jgi:hypothetical protein